MHQIEHSASEEDVGRCFTVVERAADMYPQTLGPLRNELSELFLSGREMTPENLADIQPAYHRFFESEFSPLVAVTERFLSITAGEKGMMLAVLGPSASGKDSILKSVREKDSWLFVRVRTSTTRPLREEDRVRPTYHHLPEGLFVDLREDGHFIEWLPQGDYLYGTTIAAIEAALEEEAPIKIWRGELIGLPSVQDWMGRNHPEVPFLSMFVLPKMSMGAFCSRLQETRGAEDALSWRFPKAIWELYTAGELADAVILNPPDPTQQPREAAEATLRAFEHLIS